MQPIHQTKSSEILLAPASLGGKENNEPSTPLSTKRKQVLINEKNTSILQLWDQKLRVSNDRMESYAIAEMANIERLRNVEQQVTSTVDELTLDFKNRIRSILNVNQLLPAQLPHLLAPSTLFKDGQQMSSEAFFDEMNKRYFTHDKSFEKYAETMELFRSTYLILKKNNDHLRSQLSNSNYDQEFLEMQERLESALLERDTFVALYTMAKSRAELAEQKFNQMNDPSIVELLVEKFGFIDRMFDAHSILARDLFKPDTNIEIFTNFNVQLSTGEQGYIETTHGCPPGKFKICIPNGLTTETQEILLANARVNNESASQVRVILKFRKYLFQSNNNPDETTS